MNNRVVVERNGVETVLYEPQPYQRPYHESNTDHLLALGTRNTGKSHVMRWDAIIRCMIFPGFKVLLIRRTIPDLRKSHLNFIDLEMEAIGGVFIWNTFEARFPNHSKIQFTHCEKMTDVANFLSSGWDLICFDELSTFPLDMFLMISAAARVRKDAPYKALVRACSNTLGIGSSWMKQWFVDKNVNLADFPGYDPHDFEVQYSWAQDNIHIDYSVYKKKLLNQPEHVRRSWMDLEWINEGAYFTDFRAKKDTVSWHVVDRTPTILDKTTDQHVSIFEMSWLNIYRAIDWGYFPDPAVCLWIAKLPNGHEIVFKERSWRRTLAADVAREIKLASAHMHIVETFCDPTMFIKTGTIKYSIGELFEQGGVPLTPGQNDRELAGYSVHDHLNTLVDDHPQLQIVAPAGKYGCPDLIRTIPLVQMDPTNPAKLGNGEDHWVVALAYYCMGFAAPSRDPAVPSRPRWMLPKSQLRSRGMV